MFYNILDKKRTQLLPIFKIFKKDYYLAGGTGLALQIGHRDSVDFDFFTEENTDIEKLFVKIKKVFKEYNLTKIQEEENTLSVLVADDIKISFFNYPYKLIDELIDEKNLKIASIEDIGCMKLSAIVSRASNKDYIDIYYILQKIKLGVLLKKALEKFPDLDKNLILKSLVYFKDIKEENISFKNNNYVDFKEVKSFLEEKVKEELKNEN